MEKEKYQPSDVKISDAFFTNIQKAYLSSPERANMISPEEARFCPFIVMAELLVKIVDSEHSDINKANAAYAEFHSVIISGVNPFKAATLKKAGIDPDYWNFTLELMKKKREGKLFQ